MVFKLKTSKETMKIFEEIGSSIRLQPYVLAKLALALSIKNSEPLSKEDFSTDSDGLELNRQTITGEYDNLFKVLIIHHTGNHLREEDYFPLYLKAHLDRGAKHLSSEFKYSGANFYKHLIDLDKGI